MSTEPAIRAVAYVAPGDADELARAEVYGLLSQLFQAAPDAALYGQFAVAVTVAPARGAYLEGSWGELVAAARRLDRESIRREYDSLFQGLGKPEIFLYASFHLVGRLNEQPLVDLRHALRALGLEGTGEDGITEDHIASLCQVMRFLIAGDDAATSNLAAQRHFFDAHLRPWADQLCDVLEAHPGADFYRAVGRFARDFFAVEAEGFDLFDA